MNDDSYEPQSHAAPTAQLEPDCPALAPHLDDSFFETRRLREGGWDGPKMATFIGTLAESGVVTFACRACDMSAKSAYALRHRDPLFAKAWDAALDMARQRLADELLARSLKGSAEQLLRDGAIVAERHVFDNKLAFSILRRLDRRAELGSTFSTPPAWDRPTRAPAVAGRWQELLDALTDGRTDEAGRLLAVEDEQGNSQGNDPPFDGDNSDSLDGEPEPRERVWHDWQSDEWRTDFPPPAGFDGDEKGDWEDPEGYSRSLTASEMEALVAAGLAGPEELPAEISFEEDEAERDRFFGSLLESRSAVATA
jgi:hypothetical protein